MFICLFCVGCSVNISERERVLLAPERFSAQEFYDKAISHSVITDSAGHTLILHEVGHRGKYGYSFSIEHSAECKMCYAIFD